jgi:hypothetical protein
VDLGPDQRARALGGPKADLHGIEPVGDRPGGVPKLPLDGCPVVGQRGRGEREGECSDNGGSHGATIAKFLGDVERVGGGIRTKPSGLETPWAVGDALAGGGRTAAGPDDDTSRTETGATSQMKTNEYWPFDVAKDAAVVTTSYVTSKALPILAVFHEIDEDGESTWQFHAGNGDFRAELLMLVSMREMVELDDTLLGVATLPLGFMATREHVGGGWRVGPSDG